MEKEKTIWTIGHSTHPQEEFIEWLKIQKIEVLADVRRYPGSRKFPQFKKENMEIYLPKNGILYEHFVDLGGRRKTLPDSKNSIWRHPSFRGYADYMETEEFRLAVEGLKELASEKNTAIMCSEAVWWSCHRSMISDYLKAEGWTVLHIMGKDKTNEHPYTAPANVVEGHLSYRETSED